MDCPTVQELMLEFVEGTLPVKVAEGVREHIENCAPCMKQLEKQSSRTRVLQSLARVKAPDQWEEISRSIGETAAPRRGVRLGLVLVIAAVLAAAAIIITGLLIGSRNAEPGPRSQTEGVPAAPSP